MNIVSGDSFLGIPYNIASYALLTHIIAEECDLGVGEFVHTVGDAHIYVNHEEQIKEQLSREPRESPTLRIKRNEDGSTKGIFNYSVEDFELIGYNPHPKIKGAVAV